MSSYNSNILHTHECYKVVQVVYTVVPPVVNVKGLVRH